MPTPSITLLSSLILLSPPPTTSNEQEEAQLSDRSEQPWIDRWKPERSTFELGVYGGLMFPHPRLELYRYDTSLPSDGFRRLNDTAPEIGARIGYYPLALLGIEEEVAVLPTRTQDDASALLWTARAHVLLQLPRWSVVPFAVAGLSAVGVRSETTVVGSDTDLGFHFGGGIKVAPVRRLTIRLDVRDTMTARRGLASGVVHSPEILLGMSLVLGREKPKPAPIPTPAAVPSDSDNDGIIDSDDHCVYVPGLVQYDGCPIPDTDGDGILDPNDQCITTPGVAQYEGCPIPDTDGDGILDPDDQCVDVPGPVSNHGCPIPVPVAIPDTDGDGFLDPDDACVDEPETINQFEDEDGCPDEIPDEVKDFTGVIEGIYFKTNSATVDRRSRPQLDKAVNVLREFEDLRIEISGHTDGLSYASYNRQLSEKRADAVKEYLTNAGINDSRIETRGAGETEPIASNQTGKGRAKNRRIEFKLIKQ